MYKNYDNVMDMVGSTPMVRVNHIDTGPCTLFLKMESQNPGGSIKDRIGLYMINAAEEQGLIKPGDTLVEATAGNTGLGLALAAGQKGYRMLIVVPDKMSQEKIFHLRAMGAEVVMTRSDVTKGHPEYYQDMAARLCRETPNSYYVNQFGNDANALAHQETTGPEIFEQMGGDVDAVVCGVGTGGTITGLGRFFAGHSPKTEMVLADPEGSILANYVATGEISSEVGTWLVEGIGEDFIPPVCNLDGVKTAYTIPDAEAFRTCREVLAKEGLIAGTSSGTLISAALRYCREQTKAKRVVSFVCDSGNKYLSKVYNDYWMIDQGFLDRETFGDLRDLIVRRHSDHAAVTLNATQTVLDCYRRMKMYDVSQIPVMNEGKIVGIVDEEDILLNVIDNPDHFRDPVTAAMESRLVTVSPDASLDRLTEIFRAGWVAIVMDGDEFHGLITRIDLLNWLRRNIEDKRQRDSNP